MKTTILHSISLGINTYLLVVVLEQEDKEQCEVLHSDYYIHIVYTER